MTNVDIYEKYLIPRLSIEDLEWQRTEFKKTTDFVDHKEQKKIVEMISERIQVLRMKDFINQIKN